ncbi:MAG: DNA polymerase III subunit delta' C-terminal domain-containing protein [Bacilli bacterium]|nr:DNA polymerase III subunit delta' C-terminal domain-containing protein [Bacilli bacterium]
MNFDTLLKTQKKVIKLFHNSLRKDRLVHTYLFEGAKGTSKIEAAYYFAAMILCNEKSKPCLKCEACLKIQKEIHPSIFLVKPENGTIRKDMVEKLEKEFSLTALNEDGRIYIIQDIEKATAAAANSLLKFLEEMEGDKYGILITENSNQVLSTIKSRSQIVTFEQTPEAIIAEELMMRGVEPETSYVLSQLSNSIEECLELIGEGKVLDLIELVKKVGLNLENKEKEPFLVFYEEGEFLLKDPDKKYHRIFLDLLVTLINDELSYILGETAGIIFKDTIESIAPYLGNNYQRKIKEVEILLSFKQRLNYNVNLELFYADLLIEIVR